MTSKSIIFASANSTDRWLWLQEWWNGRHEGLKILWPLPAVWVRVPLSVQNRNRANCGSVFFSTSMAQSLKMEQRIGMRLSQQQLRFVKLLELNAPELDEAVERELEDNPALGVKEETHEEDTGRYPLFFAGNNDDDRPVFTPADESESLYDHLYAQLSERRLSPKVELAARYIVGNLDSNGYLSRSLSNLVDDMAFGPGIDVNDTEARRLLMPCVLLNRLASVPSDSETALNFS